MSYSIRVLPRAKRDFGSIFEFIEQRSPEGAQRWREAFEAALKRVCDNPYSVGVAPETDAADCEVRQVPFRTRRGLTYRAVFTVRDDEVLVLRIRGPGQPPLSGDELI